MSRYCNYLGRPEDINSFLNNNKIHEIVIALENHEHDKLLQIIGQFNYPDICIKIIPDMYEAISGQVSIDTIRGLPLLNIDQDIITEYQMFLKRIGDVIFSLVPSLNLLLVSFFTLLLGISMEVIIKFIISFLN